MATGAPQKHGKSVDIVTFDSNVWRLVASPSKFPKDPSRPAYQKLHQACCSQTIQAFISETTFTLEQIPRKDRLAWLTSIGHTSGNTIVPHVSQGVQGHLNDAYAIGIRILKSKRIGGPASSLLNNNKYFWAYPSDTDFHKYNNKNGEIARQLEGMGLGIALLKALGPPASSSPPTHWIEGIATLAASKHINIPDLIAEWADVDALATSIAHDVTYFCTKDAGQSASGKGIVSAMSPTMSATITAQFGIHFISPDALAQKLNI